MAWIQNTIRWGIYLNSEQARLDKNIVVDDIIQGGQRLKKDKITIFVDKNQFRLDEFLKKYPSSSATIEDDSIHFNFSSKEFSGHKLILSYTTVITDNDLSNFDNSATVSYKLVGEEAKTVTYNKSVQNVSFDASVTGTEPGELKIIKKVSGKNEVLPGVKFKITYPTGKEVYETTDNSGVIDIKNLPAGTYKVQEVSAPDWIDIEHAKDKVYDVKVSASEKGRALIVYNSPKRTKRDTDSIPWTDYSNNKAKEVIPWTDYSNNKAKEVIPWTDYSNNKAKEVIPWTPLTPATEVRPWIPLKPSTEVTPWIELTSAKSTSEPKQETSSAKDTPSSSSTSSSSSISSVSTSSSKQVAKKGNFLPQTGEKSTVLISIVGVALVVLSIVIVLNRRKENK